MYISRKVYCDGKKRENRLDDNGSSLRRERLLLLNNGSNLPYKARGEIEKHIEVWWKRKRRKKKRGVQRNRCRRLIATHCFETRNGGSTLSILGGVAS